MNGSAIDQLKKYRNERNLYAAKLKTLSKVTDEFRCELIKQTSLHEFEMVELRQEMNKLIDIHDAERIELREEISKLEESCEEFKNEMEFCLLEQQRLQDDVNEKIALISELETYKALHINATNDLTETLARADEMEGLLFEMQDLHRSAMNDVRSASARADKMEAMLSELQEFQLGEQQKFEKVIQEKVSCVQELEVFKASQANVMEDLSSALARANEMEAALCELQALHENAINDLKQESTRADEMEALLSELQEFQLQEQHKYIEVIQEKMSYIQELEEHNASHANVGNDETTTMARANEMEATICELQELQLQEQQKYEESIREMMSRIQELEVYNLEQLKFNELYNAKEVRIQELEASKTYLMNVTDNLASAAERASETEAKLAQLQELHEKAMNDLKDASARSDEMEAKIYELQEIQQREHQKYIEHIKEKISCIQELEIYKASQVNVMEDLSKALARANEMEAALCELQEYVRLEQLKFAEIFNAKEARIHELEASKDTYPVNVSDDFVSTFERARVAETKLVEFQALHENVVNDLMDALARVNELEAKLNELQEFQLLEQQKYEENIQDKISRIQQLEVIKESQPNLMNDLTAALERADEMETMLSKLQEYQCQEQQKYKEVVNDQIKRIQELESYNALHENTVNDVMGKLERTDEIEAMLSKLQEFQLCEQQKYDEIVQEQIKRIKELESYNEYMQLEQLKYNEIYSTKEARIQELEAFELSQAKIAKELAETAARADEAEMKLAEFQKYHVRVEQGLQEEVNKLASDLQNLKAHKVSKEADVSGELEYVHITRLEAELENANRIIDKLKKSEEQLHLDQRGLIDYAEEMKDRAAKLNERKNVLKETLGIALDKLQFYQQEWEKAATEGNLRLAK